MKETLQAIIKGLVDDLDAVSILEKEDGNSVIFEVRVASKDMGKIIGKNGKVARAIRTLMKALGTKDDKKVLVEFVD